MSSISAVAGGGVGGVNWAAQVDQAASQAAKHVDRDGDHDGNKPDAVAEATKYPGASVKMLDMKV